MLLSAWITSIAVAVFLYGGFAICVGIAVKRGREEKGGDAGETSD